MNEEQLKEFLSTRLYEIANVLMAYYDFCQIKGFACKASNPSLCCINTIFGKGLCKYSVDRVCTNPNAECRLWICNTAMRDADPIGVEAIKKLEELGALFSLVRAPLTGHPYSGADKNMK